MIYRLALVEVISLQSSALDCNLSLCGCLVVLAGVLGAGRGRISTSNSTAEAMGTNEAVRE